MTRLQVVLKLVQPYTRIRIAFVSTQVTKMPAFYFAVTLNSRIAPPYLKIDLAGHAISKTQVIATHQDYGFMPHIWRTTAIAVAKLLAIRFGCGVAAQYPRGGCGAAACVFDPGQSHHWSPGPGTTTHVVLPDTYQPILSPTDVEPEK